MASSANPCHTGLANAVKQGMISAADAQAMLGIAGTATTGIMPGSYPDPLMFRQRVEFETTPHTMLYHASVEKAENGFILKITHKQGEQPKIYVAADTAELQRVFIAAIVDERISK